MHSMFNPCLFVYNGAYNYTQKQKVQPIPKVFINCCLQLYDANNSKKYNFIGSLAKAYAYYVYSRAIFGHASS